MFLATNASYNYIFEMIADLDKLGQWIEGARNSVKQASGVVQHLICTSLMYATYQITVWGYRQNIEDYAIKQWAGL